MFDSNYDEKEGVSIWDHVVDGASTGAMGGALFGGVGAIPGAIGGGLLGLANGLWESHDDAVAEQTWMSARHDDKTVDRVEQALESVALDPASTGMSDDQAYKLAAEKVYRHDRAAQEKQDTSWFDGMF